MLEGSDALVHDVIAALVSRQVKEKIKEEKISNLNGRRNVLPSYLGCSFLPSFLPSFRPSFLQLSSVSVIFAPHSPARAPFSARAPLPARAVFVRMHTNETLMALFS